jgi:hypothetical protein
MDNPQKEETPPLTTVVNFRDISKIAKTVKPGLLFRSAQIGDSINDDMNESQG